ncbi:sulfite exporter TauE/SafE family protein [Caenimonas sedimenti]|uniref:Probable membrane transporter protein n=1 Tax=Caenimonas sedimenti TaxID=2596921 RepID=A0A562ZDD3_9BURK|nr:sulfite exporter TauE/SafE family protein [Caenimonas sedimenti]TWO63077.1 sulfite exporter TauE/SafE family protein [Caenimonas sedimenti]
MLHDHIPHFFLVSVIFFGAGIVKGVLGMGLPTFAMGLLGLLMPVPQAAGMLTVPSLVTNLWQSLVGGQLQPLLRRLWPLLLGVVAGVCAAAWLPPANDQVGRVLLGACLLVYGGSGLAGWRLRAPSAAVQAVAGPVVGSVTGIVTGLTGMFVIPAVPYLQSVQLDRNELAQALGLSFTTSTVALAVLLAAQGQLGWQGSLQSLLALAPALAGMALGQKLRQDMNEALFRRCFFAGLVALGGWLVAR